jgi:ABC-2 type transport system ATP-binding protein
MISPSVVPAISVSNLVKTYRANGPRVVDGISFMIQSGTIFSLLGPNGAGKTTIIKMILGLVTPTQGEVCLAGYPIARQRNQALRHAGAVLEGSRNIYWRLSARGNLEYFGGLRGMQGRDLKQRIADLLNLLELSNRADEETRNFSRGMQQKVALAVAILHNPDVLLLDEPTLGLDVQAARTIKEAIRKLTCEEGKAVLLTTHQMDLAEEVSDRIFVINHGQKVAEGTPQDVIAQFGEPGKTVEIRLGTLIDELTTTSLQAAFLGLLSMRDGDNTILTWVDGVSQRQLIDLLAHLDAEGLPILSVGRREPTLEEVFIRLTAPGGRTR